MKKILIVFDGAHFSGSAFLFASALNELQTILLTGVFLPSVYYSDIVLYYLGGAAGSLYIPAMENEELLIEKNIERFGELCRKHGIEYRVHNTAGNSAADQIQKETRFADLLILSNETFYDNLGEGTQQVYLSTAMRKAECPILLVPEQYDFPEKIILAYDGSEASVFAIKQFAYLFPELREKETLLVYANPSEKEIPDLRYIEELAARHYNDLTIFKLEAEPNTYFNTWITNSKQTMLVAGSYGRSSFSEMFKKSFVQDVIKDHKLPLFITHP